MRGWPKRFNAEELTDPDDRPRSGKLLTYTSEQAGAVVAAAPVRPEGGAS